MVNYLAILVAAIASMIIGGLWYSPILFGKKWLKEMKIEKSDMPEMKKKANKSYVIMFLSSLVMAYALSRFIILTNTTTLAAGLLIAFLAWLGFLATSLLGSVLWEGKSISLYLINASNYLVTLLVMGAILVSWP